ncbi:phosphodiester glycosidase family protein [Rubellimicrobium aerolatum]|uniref:Phosphodiester glycosidase family protein n=1 Tax=Rubellimicrobium aerolatum TaxID=490979 RepID=A0ABW0SGJ4_9RHOB
MRVAALAALALLLPATARALDCRDVTWEGLPFAVCEVDARAERLSLFLNDAGGQPYGSFAAVEADHGPLAFAMNAGMYHEDRRPVGLYREAGRDLAPLVTQPGPGNFGLLPNGLLCLSGDGAFVVESLAYAAGARACDSATQSGPLLVIGSELHPRFLPDSDSRHIRNGVGTSADGSRAVFAISDSPVTFHEFARFFRDGLGLPDALYLDGSISRLYAPPLGRDDWGLALGPIVGLLAADARP